MGKIEINTSTTYFSNEYHSTTNSMAEEGWEVVPVRRGRKQHSRVRELVQNADDSRQHIILGRKYNIRSLKFPMVSLPIIQRLVTCISGLRIVNDILVVTDEDMFIEVSAAGESKTIFPTDGSEPYAKMYTIYMAMYYLPVATIETVRRGYTFSPDNTRFPCYKFSDKFEIIYSPDLKLIPRQDLQDVFPLITSFLY